MGDQIPVRIRLDGRAVDAETLLISSAYAVVLTTTLATPQEPLTLCSTYLGQRGESTAAAHLAMVADSEPELVQRRHAAHELPVAEDERRLCLLDHLHQLADVLEQRGRTVAIDVADQALEVVDR